MEFKLPFWVRNQGDGSVGVIPAKTLLIAETNDSVQDEGWGESSADIIKLKVEDGKLFYYGYLDDDDESYERGWVQVEES